MKRTDFLKRLVGVAIFGQMPLSVLETKRKIYLLQCFVAGFRHYKGMELLSEMEVNDFIELRREPENEYDEFAIALYWQQEKIGFIPANYNETIARLLDAEALPLLATITHLNKEVKPWENVEIAVYFLQEESKNLKEHAGYLKKLVEPEYTTHSKNIKRKKENLMDDLFNCYDRIIHIPSIPNTEAREYYKKYFGDKKIFVKGEAYALVDNDGFYHYMYNSSPIEWVTDDEGKAYLLFEFLNDEF